MLRFEDSVFGSPVFLKTAEAAIRSLLHLYGQGQGQGQDQNGGAASHLSTSLATLSIADASASDTVCGEHHLVEAARWADKLVLHRANDPAAHWLAWNVYRQKGGLPLKAIRSLYHAIRNGKGGLSEGEVQSTKQCSAELCHAADLLDVESLDAGADTDAIRKVFTEIEPAMIVAGASPSPSPSLYAHASQPSLEQQQAEASLPTPRLLELIASLN